jgi:hypothetical protein
MNVLDSLWGKNAHVEYPCFTSTDITGASELCRANSIYNAEVFQT